VAGDAKFNERKPNREGHGTMRSGSLILLQHVSGSRRLLIKNGHTWRNESRDTKRYHGNALTGHARVDGERLTSTKGHCF
jgi:hypothetical protein